MGSSDGHINGTTKIVDHGPDTQRFNVVILGDGYQASEMTKYHNDVQNFVNIFQTTAPYDDIWCAINFHRVDVVSTDSGADDPATCADGSTGTGASPHTYFDSGFCKQGIRRALGCDSSLAASVASSQVPQVNMTMVIVNTSEYGGLGGQIAVFSTAASADEIGLHEMGHTAFQFADEYEYYAGCGSGETGHDHYSGGEPGQPNVTINTNKNTIKWHAELTTLADSLPTTTNADCTQCDPQGNPKADSYVGAYEGADYVHCGCYRPSFNCRMRALGFPFCAVCQRVIRNSLAPYMPASVTITWPNPADIIYGTPLGPTQLDATATVAGNFAYTPPSSTLLPAGSYTLNVLFTPTDFADYCFAKGSAHLNVLKATPNINWANPADITYGTVLDGTQLNATASWVVGGFNVSVPGTFTYTPGLNTLLPAGVHTLTVQFMPFDTANYNSATATVQLNVLKATPVITWADPPDIDHGTALDNTMLDATASWIVAGSSVTVPGMFTYTPPNGTVLPIGLSQPLNVLFTPNDTANYNTATDTVHINVLTGYPIVMSVTFSPTDLQREECTNVTVTVKNDSIKPHPTQGPNPGFEYSEGDTFKTKGFPSVAGAYRIAVDMEDSPYKQPYLYRWGFGHDLAPGETVTVTGAIRFHNSRENGNYFAAMIDEVDQVVQDHQGTTGIVVERP